MISTLALAGCQGGAAGPTGPQSCTEPTRPQRKPCPRLKKLPRPKEAAPAEKPPAAEPEPTAAPEATAVPTAVPATAGDVPTGYYNLADFATQTGKTFEKYGEAPMLAERVAAGDLPPVEERLPNEPARLSHDGQGGRLRRHPAL